MTNFVRFKIPARNNQTIHPVGSMKTRHIISLLAALGLSYVAGAQNVTRVSSYPEGKDIAITYALDEKANISVYVTRDDGQTRTQIPKAYLSGDIGKKVSSGRNKKALWHFRDQFPDQSFPSDDLRFIVVGKPVMQLFVAVNGGYAPDSGPMLGATIGQVGIWGWYVKGMSTLSTPRPTEYECDENGSVSGTLPAYSGTAAKAKAYGVAGLTLRLGAPVYLNAGVGYGSRQYAWELNDGRWVKHLPESYGSVAIDGGLMVKLGHIALSAGATWLGGRTDFNGGVAYVF